MGIDKTGAGEPEKRDIFHLDDLSDGPTQRPSPGSWLASMPPRTTLRDQFAMAALTGLLANPEHEGEGLGARFFAECAYEVAEEMMKAREGGE